MDFPKPVNYVKLLVQQIASEPDSLVLDFFAGSCTTAQAVLELNREDGGSRRFAMVQLPEPSDRPRYATISEIGKERMRRVIKRMAKEKRSQLPLQDRAVPEDLGFKVFTLERSNYKAWQDYSGEDIQQLVTLFDSAETPLVDGWKPDDVLTETLLLEGFPLDSIVKPQTEYKHNKVILVESDACAHRLFVCLDKKLKDDTIEQLKLNSDDIFVCLDSALIDEAKVRLSDTGNLHVI